MKSQKTSVFCLGAFFALTALAQFSKGDPVCNPQNPNYLPANEFRESVERGDLAGLRAAWNKLNKNNDGQTNLRQCFRGMVGLALKNRRFALADHLMGPEFNFPINEYDEDAAENRRTAIQ